LPKCSKCGNALTLAERARGTTVCAACTTASVDPRAGDVVRVIPPAANPNTYLMVVERPNGADPKKLRLRRLPDDGRPATYTSKPEFFNHGHGTIQDTSETSHALIDVAAFNDFFTHV